MTQPQWRELLEQSVNTGGRAAHWTGWYHLAVMHYRAGDLAGARQAWEQSLRAEPNVWSARDLAFLAIDQCDEPAAVDLYLKAAAIAPHLIPLAIECAKVLLQTRRFAQLTKFADSLPPEVQSTGRLRLLRAMAALEQGDLTAVENYFEGDVDIPNIREKEIALSDLWFRWQEQRVARERGVPIDDALRSKVRRDFPPPMRFDFRLRTAD
jgi:predicted TPR repeat methyltransferase